MAPRAMCARGLVPLVVAMVGFAAAQCTAPAGYTLLKYDVDKWPDHPAAAPALPAGTCSPPYIGSAIEVVQLLTPPSVPWNITKVCVQLNATIAGAQDVEVTLYEEDHGSPSRKEIYSRRSSVSLVTTSISWATVSLLDLVVASPRAYLGFRVYASCNQVFYNTQTLWRGRRAFWRKSSTDAWSLFGADWASDNTTVVSIRTVGQAKQGVPPAWNCSSSFYNDSVCHCQCGAPDPDCQISPLSPSCTAPGSVCSPLGTCVLPGWNTQICPLTSYGTGDGCQCGCGGSMIDPDCREISAAGDWYPRALNCPGLNVAKCSDAGLCVETWSTCTAAQFKDGVCHCKCGTFGGVADPDCLVTNRSDCGSGSTCFEGGCRGFPDTWICAISMYNQFPQLTHHPKTGSCQCNCGAWDPDCTFQQYSDIMWADGCNEDQMVCSRNVTCKYSSPHGDRVVDAEEECDSGRGCGTNSRCLTGFISTVPISFDCIENCGDGLIVGLEECDSGTFCSSQCKCLAGHSAIGQRYCSGCGNGVKEAGEECDSGQGCDSSCRCVKGFETSGNTSTDCYKSHSFCGDSSVDPGEDCDGGSFCYWQNCTCFPGHQPYAQRSKGCRGCGNGVEEDSEECDGTEGCNPQTCTCVDAYQKRAGVVGCQLIDLLCGNGKVDTDEECDGGVFCQLGCTCEAGHSSVKGTRQQFCSGCGNDYIDDGEQCDGGYGCAANCTCLSDFMPSNPPTTSCVWVPPSDPGKNSTTVVEVHRKKDGRVTGAAAGVSIGAAVLVCGVLGAVVGIVSSIRKKEEPSRPVENPDSEINFVAAAPPGGVNLSGNVKTVFKSHASASEMAQMSPYIHSRGPDGTPIIVVPCSAGSEFALSPKVGNMEVIPGNIVPAGPVDPLVSMCLEAQLPQISAMIQQSLPPSSDVTFVATPNDQPK